MASHNLEPIFTSDTTLAGEPITPSLISPPESKTPPTDRPKRGHDATDPAMTDRQSEPVDPSALSKALEEYEQAGRQRERTPTSSPIRKRQRIAGDRFIPNRTGQDLAASYQLLHDDGTPATPSRSHRGSHSELNFQRVDEANRTFKDLLRTELFDDRVPQTGSSRAQTPPTSGNPLFAGPTLTPSTPNKNLFSFATPRNSNLTPHRTPSSRRTNMNPHSELYSLSPVKLSSQNMLLSPRKTPREVSKVPYKVLDAPDLQDDFYLNLVDWGSQNILGVGLGSCVYMWNSQSGRVTKLCDLGDDSVTSVNWIQRGSHLAIGTQKGFVQIWDATCQRRLRTMTGHSQRVGALAWNEHILSSGSRDRTILHRDVRSPSQWEHRLASHKQEVCGLKWNADTQQLASGGNDNKLMIWDRMNEEPLFKWGEHNAAVKAIAWSPHQRGLLASGGGTADRTIKFWNTNLSDQAASSAANIVAQWPQPSSTSSSTNPTAQPSTSIPETDARPTPANLINSIDTGSQVCNLAWSRNSNELVSTHGYSQNQIVVWKYPRMEQVVALTGHTYRVLYLAMSPDGQVIVTGAGDETLRFWQCFKKKERSGGGLGALGGWGVIR